MKDIPGYEGRYAITTAGEVYSYPKRKGRNFLGGYLKYGFDIDGYRQVALTLPFSGKIRNWKIHKLIAITYIPNPENLPCVNHKNGINTDNRIENLEWCTNQYNVRDGWNRGRKSTLSKKVMQLTKEGILCKIYESCHEAGRLNGLHFQNISACALGKKKIYGGYSWEYLTTQ